MELVAEFDAALYRKLHGDLAQFGEEQLRAHYQVHGRGEGRRANRLRNRAEFVAQIPSELSALEIGPFAAPLLSGAHVRHCDIMDRAGLRKLAQVHGLDPERVPHIHYVLGAGGLDTIAETFDVLLSSHNLEHQPDLVAHLQQVERRLVPGGRYFLLVPDQRYCFDRFNAPSSIADVLEAHAQRRMTHSLRSVIRHHANTTHNDFARHWAEPSAAAPATSFEGLTAALRAHEAAAGGYIDVHGWYFTPDAFGEIIALLRQLGEIQLETERVYATRRNANEFWAVLRKRELDHVGQ